MNADFTSPTTVNSTDNFGAARMKETRTHHRLYGDVRTSRSDIFANEIKDVLKRVKHEMGGIKPTDVKFCDDGDMLITYPAGIIWKVSSGGHKNMYVRARVIARISGAMLVTEII